MTFKLKVTNYIIIYFLGLIKKHKKKIYDHFKIILLFNTTFAIIYSLYKAFINIKFKTIFSKLKHKGKYPIFIQTQFLMYCKNFLTGYTIVVDII